MAIPCNWYVNGAVLRACGPLSESVLEPDSSRCPGMRVDVRLCLCLGGLDTIFIAIHLDCSRCGFSDFVGLHLNFPVSDRNST